MILNNILLWTSLNPIYTSLIIFLIITILILIFVKNQLLQSDDTKILLFSALILFFIQLILPSNFGVYTQYKDIIRLSVSLIPIAISVFLCLKYWKNMDNDLKNGKYGDSIYPTLMVSQGTFFTFVGISAILFSYDTKGNDINMLLTGLKLAFVTSVIGLVFSIAAKKYIKDNTEAYVNQNRGIVYKEYIDEKDFFNAITQLNNNIALLVPMTKNIKENMFVAATASVKANEDREQIVRNVLSMINESLSENTNKLESHLASTQKITEDNFSMLVEHLQKCVTDSFKNMEVGIGKLDAAYSNLSDKSDMFVNKMTVVGDEEEKLVKKLTELNTEVFEKLTQQSDGIVQRSNKLLDSIELLTEQSNNQHIANIKALKDCFQATMLEFKQASSTTNSEYKQQLKMLEDSQKNTFDKFEAYSTEFRHKITDSVHEIVQQLEVNVSEIKESSQVIKNEYELQTKCMQEKHTSIVKELNSETNEFIKSMQVLSSKVQENVTGLDNLMQVVDQKIRVINDTITDNDNKFSSVQTQYTNLVSGLTAQFALLKTGLEQLEPHITLLQTSMNQVNKEISDSGENFKNNIGDISKKATEIAGVVKSFETFEVSLKQYHTIFDSIAKNLEKYNNTLDLSNNSINEVNARFLDGQALIKKNYFTMEKQLNTIATLVNKIEDCSKDINTKKDALALMSEIYAKELNKELGIKTTEQVGNEDIFI